MIQLDPARRNYLYFQYERRALAAMIAAGFVLVLGLLWGMFWGTGGIVADTLWAGHILLHLFSVGAVLGLLGLMTTALSRPRRYAFLAAAGCVTVTLGLMTMLPITSRDALLYHLAVPKWWLEEGTIGEISWHEWSHFPLLLSVSYMGFVAHGYELLAPFYHGTFLILAAGIVAAFVQYKYQDEELSLLAAAIVGTTPICLRLAGEPMADLALAVYFGAGFAWFLFWGDQHSRRAELVWIGALFGLALSVKYNSFLALSMFCLAMLSFLQQWRRSLAESALIIAMLGGSALLVVSPWLAKNWWFTGNPLYPFAGKLFGSSASAPFQGSVSLLDHHLQGYGEQWWELLLTPVRMMTIGRDDQPRLFDGVLSPIYLLIFVTLVRMREAERWVGSTWLFVAGYFLTSLFLFYPLIRYQSPLLVPATVLAIAGLRRLEAVRGGALRGKLRLALVLVQLSFVAFYGVMLWHRLAPLAYLRGQESREEYLARQLDEYPLIQLVNAELPADACVYLMYTGNRFFYYDRSVRGAYFSDAPVAQWLSAGSDDRGLVDHFRELGVTHIAMHNRRIRDVLDGKLSADEKRVWTNFVQRDLELLRQTGPFSLWRIR